MAKVFLALLFCFIEPGNGVRLTEFLPIDSQSINDSLIAFWPGSHPYVFHSQYVNETLFCSSYDMNSINPQVFFVTIINVTDGTMSHRVVNAPFDELTEDGEQLEINNQIYMVVTGEGNDTMELKRLLRWDQDKWRTLNGQFPYALANQKSCGFKTNIRSFDGQPGLVYIANECVSRKSGRYDFHRLELVDDKVTMRHVGGFEIKPWRSVNFFTVFNNKLMVFLYDNDVGLLKYTLPIAESGSNVGDNSTGVVTEVVPDFDQGWAVQVDNFAVFITGHIGRPESNTTYELFPNATIMDLNTMQLTETFVYYDPYSMVSVDKVGKRLFSVDPSDEIKVATLIA